MLKLIKILPFLLIAAACDGSLNDAMEEPSDSIEPKLEILSETITPNGGLRANYILENTSGELVTYHFNSGRKTSYKIKKNGITIFDHNDNKNFGWTPTRSKLYIPGYTSRTFNFKISFDHYLDKPLKKGTYTLEVFMFAGDGQKAKTQFVVE